MSEFDGLADECRANSGYTSRMGCGVSDFLQSLAGDDADKVVEVLKDRTISARAISEALKKRASNVPSTYTIQRHRQRNCHCYRELK